MLAICVRRTYILLTMARKLHVEISPANWKRTKEFIQRYNDNPKRLTPRYKPADVINLALADYLRARRS